MRLSAMAFLFLMHGLCHAQTASLVACMDKLAANPGFALLADKLAVGATGATTPAMLDDTSLANNRQRPVIAEWAAARAGCLKADSRYGNAVYRAPMQTFGIDAENKVMAAAVELYDGKISFGEFNHRRQAIAEELREKAAGLRQRIQSQQTALEQADRQAREREQMQREIDEAEQQAALARRQAEAAREIAARRTPGSRAPDGLRRPEPAAVVRFRDCYRFGSRYTCTGW